jgi:hypothetical protein
MESFKLWLEGNTDIQYLGTSKWAGHASVKFVIRGKRGRPDRVYEYAVDPAFLEGYSKDGRQFYATKDKAPWVAFNLIKKNGTLIEPKPKPQPKPAPTNWPEDWELENRKQQARMQGDDVTPAPKTPFKNTTGDEAIDAQLTKTETMTPDEYLRQAWEATDGKLGGTYESWLASNKLTDAARAKYVQAMKDGDEFPLPYIDKYKGSQDGRNRALAAKEAGIEEIPVGIIEKPSVDVQLKDLRAELETTTSKMGKARIQEKIDKLDVPF